MNFLFNIVEMIPEFVEDAFKDSIALLPFLFVIFVFIEIFENYFSKKIVTIMRCSKKVGPVIAAAFAIIPQCGFSIIATLLYVRKLMFLMK